MFLRKKSPKVSDIVHLNSELSTRKGPNQFLTLQKQERRNFVPVAVQMFAQVIGAVAL